MSRSDFVLLKGHRVKIATNFRGDSTRLFWDSGTVTHVDDEILILKNGDRLKQIPLREIREIHLDNRSG